MAIEPSFEERNNEEIHVHSNFPECNIQPEEVWIDCGYSPDHRHTHIWLKTTDVRSYIDELCDKIKIQEAKIDILEKTIQKSLSTKDRE